MNQSSKTEIEAAVFRKLLSHLDSRKDVQNIDLMNLAGFCRNCLAKWYSAEAEERGEEVSVLIREEKELETMPGLAIRKRSLRKWRWPSRGLGGQSRPASMPELHPHI